MNIKVNYLVNLGSRIVFSIALMLSGVALHHLAQQQKVLEPMCVAESVTYVDSQLAQALTK